MPWLLYRYILVDIGRIFLLTTIVIVVVIAFGAAMKPLTSGNIIGAGQVAKYVFLVMVPMLQFALPFAAGFSATLALHRFANDNEVIAIAVSGISYRKMFVPIVGMGVALMIIMIALTQFIIPRFWTHIERAIATDAVKMLQSSVSSGSAFQAGNLQIFADRILVDEEPAGTDAQTRLVLFNVAAAEMDSDRRIVREVTARRAIAYVFERDNQRYLDLEMEDTVAYNANTRELAQIPEIRPEGVIALTTELHTDPRAMTRNQLLRLRARPASYHEVVQARDHLAQAIGEYTVKQAIAQQVRETGRAEFIGVDGDSTTLIVNAGRFEDNHLFNRDGASIEASHEEGGQTVRRYTARRVELAAAPGATINQPLFDLTFYDCRIENVQRQIANQRESLTLHTLLPRNAPPFDAEMPIEDLLAAAESIDQEAARIDRLADRVEHELSSIQYEIRSRIWKRYAMSYMAPILLLLGAALAIIMRANSPLLIYLWAFLPAVLDSIVISGGDQMMRDGAVLAGGAVMWSGNVVLTIMFLMAFYRLTKH